MRDRLIEFLKKKYDHFCDQCGVNKDSHYIENLADYLLENGVIVPPCKVGDTVYFVERNSGKPIGDIIAFEVLQVGRTKNNDTAKARIIGSDSVFEIPHFTIDNYSFFLSEEEAKKALKEGVQK